MSNKDIQNIKNFYELCSNYFSFNNDIISVTDFTLKKTEIKKEIKIDFGNNEIYVINELIINEYASNCLQSFENLIDNYNFSIDPKMSIIRKYLGNLTGLKNKFINIDEVNEKVISKKLNPNINSILGSSISRSWYYIVRCIEVSILNLEQLNSPQNEEQIENTTPLQSNIKVMLMYELGIIQYLTNKFSNFNNSELNPTDIGRIINFISGIDGNTARQTYREIIGEREPNPFKDSKKKSILEDTYFRLKIKKKGNP